MQVDWKLFVSVQGIESFLLGILLISAMVLDRLTCLCRQFLWGEKDTHVAWKTMYLSKEYSGLSLRDINSWNDALLTKTL